MMFNIRNKLFTFVDNAIQDVFANIGSDYAWPPPAHQSWM